MSCICLLLQVWWEVCYSSVAPQEGLSASTDISINITDSGECSSLGRRNSVHCLLPLLQIILWALISTPHSTKMRLRGRGLRQPVRVSRPLCLSAWLVETGPALSLHSWKSHPLRACKTPPNSYWSPLWTLELDRPAPRMRSASVREDIVMAAIPSPQSPCLPLHPVGASLSSLLSLGPRVSPEGSSLGNISSFDKHPSPQHLLPNMPPPPLVRPHSTTIHIRQHSHPVSFPTPPLPSSPPHRPRPLTIIGKPTDQHPRLGQRYHHAHRSPALYM